MDVDHDFRKEGMLFDGSNDTRSAPIPLVVLDIILDTEHLVGHCLGRKCQLTYNKRKREEANHSGWKKRSIFSPCHIGRITSYDTILMGCI